VDLFNYRIEFISLFLLFFYACESSVSNSNSDSDDFEISAFSVIYNNQENDISIYTEVSNATNIESIVAHIRNDMTSIETITLSQSNFNASAFSYYGPIDLSDEIYIYNLDLIINFIDDSQILESYSFSSPIKPEIIDYTMPNTFQLDSTEWTFLPIEIEISNLNGLDNIESVTYQVQRFYNGCGIDDCIYDENCNDPIEDSEYQSDPTWIFDYVSSYNFSQNHIYNIDIPMRPLDGSGYYNDDGTLIFSESDCGRIGTVLFKFIVLDKDGLMDEEFDIVLEITQ
tara:strand:+ start:214 stop:1068 length:855 start_codon:yes stop_codon:yes gene_type:complete